MNTIGDYMCQRIGEGSDSNNDDNSFSDNSKLSLHHLSLRIRFPCLLYVKSEISIAGYSVGGSPERHDPGCAPGFRFFVVSCIDIDECAEGSHNCREGKRCRNLDGGFDCVDDNDAWRNQQSGRYSKTSI